MITEKKDLITWKKLYLVMKIKSIKTEAFKGNVYNFSVKNTHNYIVKGVVVHNCNYCYTSATKFGSNFVEIVNKAHTVWGSLPENERPFQIAIGGAGESTIHPDWIEFVKEVKSLGIMPNYTTNGMHLSPEILKATQDYCGGVALSWHPHIAGVFHKAIKQLSELNTKLNVHLILSDEFSYLDMVNLYEEYNDIIDYFVILPYQAAGRGTPIDTDTTWKKTFIFINEVESSKFAFGALFYNWLLRNDIPLKLSIYEPEIYSGYRMMDESYMLLRTSSYDLSEKTIKR